MLLLATQKEEKSTLCHRCQYIFPLVKPLPLLLSYIIPWRRRLSSANTSIVVVEVFNIIFLWRCLRCRGISLGPVVEPYLPPSSSLIPWRCQLVLVLRQRLRRCCWFLKPTPPSLLSIPRGRKHTAAYVVGDVQSGASSLLVPLLTPPLSLSSPRFHLPLSTPLLLSRIPQSRHCDAAASVVATKLRF